MKISTDKKRSNQYAFVLWAGLGIVLLFNLLVWIYLNQVEEKFSDELKDKLNIAGQLMSRLIDPEQIKLLIPGEQNTLQYLYHQQLLEEIRKTNSLQSIILVSPMGEILVSAPERLSTQQVSVISGSPYFKQAMSGKSSVSDLQEFAGEKFMTALMPIKDIDGFPQGVQIIEAKATYFDVIDILRNRLLLFSFINLIVILLIAILLFRVINRSMRYRAAIKEREHLVQLGTMAATVAHELRNPLGIIEGTNDIIKKKYGGSGDEIFEYIPQELKRLVTIIDNFLRFARAPQLQLSRFSISILLQKISVGLNKDELKRLEIIPAADNLEISSDENLLEQSLLNIIINALQASGENGKVTLEIKSGRKNRCRIIIKDSGPGIPNENMNKIFEPFYTTREKGTGLGLAITKRLIEQLDGSISVRNLDPVGCEFVVNIPDLSDRKGLKN
ncbi:MAG: ATP-binding protein [Calditrichaceae bacterium]